MDDVCLADKRQRRRWSQDPRNVFWSKDQGRFGYRMLEKMGWADGKGLGIREDGPKEHIKIKKKNDVLGVGAKKSRDHDWIAHQDSFDNLLLELNDLQSSCKSSSLPQAKDLVGTAAKSRKLLYHKFLKSKDLSMKSDTDMACVLGKRQHKRENRCDDKEFVLDNGDVDDTVCSVTHGITTIKSELNLQEYFSAKMTAIKTEAKEYKDNIDICTGAASSHPTKSSIPTSKSKKKRHKQIRIRT